MIKVVIVNGGPGNGKTTFEEMCLDIIGREYANICSTIEPIKDAAHLLGWNGEKDAQSRKFLSDLKDMASKTFDTSFNYIKEKIRHGENFLRIYDLQDTYTMYFFVDSREPEEIARFVREFNAITVLVRRPGANTIISNHADAEVENYNYDYIINNDGDLEDLKEHARTFVYILKNS